MKLDGFREQMSVTFLIASAIVSTFCSYVWSYHFAPYDLKFPTPWSVFVLSMQISAVIVWVTDLVFAAPMLFARHLKDSTPKLTDHSWVAFLALLVQVSIFLSPQFSEEHNPFLFVLFIAPLVASVVFIMLRQPQTAQVDIQLSGSISGVPK